MALLAMFLGIGFGCIMFIGYAFALLCRPYSDKILDDWLDSLTPEERKAYWFHERRKKEWLKLRKKQHKICMRLRQEMYDQTGRDDYWQAWGIASAEVGINDYPDVYRAKDCPATKWTGSWAINCWRSYKPAPPTGTTDDWLAGLRGDK